MLALVLSTVLTAVPAQGPVSGSTATEQVRVSASTHGTAMLAEPRNDMQDSMQNPAPQGDSTDSNQQQLGN